MRKVKPGQAPEGVRSLFSTTEPQARRCFAVLNGADPDGVILADDPHNPKWAAVMEPYDGVVYLAGRLDASTAAEIFALLRRDGEVQVGLWPGDARFSLLPPCPYYDGMVLEFYERPKGRDLEHYLHAMPSGLELRRIDRTLVMRTLWGPDDVRRAGSFEAWDAKHMGYCLLRGDEVLCEASASPQAIGLRELGVITKEGQRGKGYATLTAARLITEIERQGGDTYWNCAKQNEASAAVARKLGYRIEREYRCLAWKALT